MCFYILIYLNHNFQNSKKLKSFFFLVFKFDFQGAKLWLSSCKLSNILGLTIQLLNPSRKPSKNNLLSKSCDFQKFSNFAKHGYSNSIYAPLLVRIKFSWRKIRFYSLINKVKQIVFVLWVKRDESTELLIIVFIYF